MHFVFLFATLLLLSASCGKGRNLSQSQNTPLVQTTDGARALPDKPLEKLLEKPITALRFTDSTVLGQETHGGDVVLCTGKPTVVLDYFHATLPRLSDAQPPRPNMEALDYEQVIAYFKSRLAHTDFLIEFERALNTVGDAHSWIAADLREVQDSNEPYLLPEGCDLKQVALRQGLSMFIDQTLGKELSQSQLAMLVVHEALYLIAVENKQRTSENVRHLVRVLMDGWATLGEQVAAVQALGGRYSAFENLGGWENYEPSGGDFRFSLKFFSIDARAQTVSANYINASGIKLAIDPLLFRCDLSALRDLCELLNPDAHEFREPIRMKIIDRGRKIVWLNDQGREVRPAYFRR